jgi:hypothetical protein
MTDILICSGGQTGADRGALRSALRYGWRIDGWCPKGRRAEDGVIPPEFTLRETESDDYRERTRFNVRDSEATLILTYEKLNALTGGTKLTLGVVTEMRKRSMVLSLERDADAMLNRRAGRFIRGWIEHHRIYALNVAGPRESKAPGIEQHTMLVVGIAVQPRDRCICGRIFPATVWQDEGFARGGVPLRCSTCKHATSADDFNAPPSDALEAIRVACGT